MDEKIRNGVREVFCGLVLEIELTFHLVTTLLIQLLFAISTLGSTFRLNGERNQIERSVHKSSYNISKP